MRHIIVPILGIFLAACGSDPVTGTGGSTASTGGSDSSSSSSGGSGGGTTTTTASTGGSGGSPCDVPSPYECGPVVAGYKDPFASYNDIMFPIGPVSALTGRSPTGAAEAWLGPWATAQTFEAIDVFVYVLPGLCDIPETLKIAAWTEPLCGMPTDDPNLHAVEFPVGSVDVTPVTPEITRLRYVLDPFEVEAGLPLYLAQILTEDDLCLATINPAGKSAPRALWYGLVDNNCDGIADDTLGHARLDSPTAPEVEPYPYDEAFAVIPAGTL